MAYTITKRLTQKGFAFDLYYRWQGIRYRPLLGYNLSSDEAERLAIEMIGKIHKAKQNPPIVASVSATLLEFLPTYWQTLKIQKRIGLRRPEIILETHLLPRFGNRPLDSLSAQDGLAYISARLEAGAAAGTIRKEWGVLMRILNLAVDFEKIDRNRLKRVQLPEANKRTRVATIDELKAIQSLGDAETWRVAEIALHTGLREAKILEIERSWMQLRDDGWWLLLPPARSALKGTPGEIPLNRLALAALKSEVSDGPIFHKRTGDALNKAWARLCKRSQVHDLHFHDLRHTFTTLLQNLGVPLEIRSALLGHRLRSDSLGSETMTARYSHGGHGWNKQLRRAVTLLETAILSDGLSYRGSSDGRRLTSHGVNSSEDLGKSWWSQRDLNPCLSLERTEEYEEKQRDKIGEPSNE